jgi:hypothetical protein
MTYILTKVKLQSQKAESQNIVETTYYSFLIVFTFYFLAILIIQLCPQLQKIRASMICSSSYLPRVNEYVAEPYLYIIS